MRQDRKAPQSAKRGPQWKLPGLCASVTPSTANLIVIMVRATARPEAFHGEQAVAVGYIRESQRLR